MESLCISDHMTYKVCTVGSLEYKKWQKMMFILVACRVT